jgi:hypothetical protein
MNWRVNNMSEIKTVTYEGKVYQLGGVYEFSDKGRDWALDELLYLDEGKDLPFCTREYEWQLIREANYSMGTITPAPIELINGAAYMFDPHNTKLLDVIGLYEKNNNQFYFNGRHVVLAHCSNIRLMTVESK